MLTFEIMTLCTEWHRLYIIVNFFFQCFPFSSSGVYNFLFLIFLFLLHEIAMWRVFYIFHVDKSHSNRWTATFYNVSCITVKFNVYGISFRKSLFYTYCFILFSSIKLHCNWFDWEMASEKIPPFLNIFLNIKIEIRLQFTQNLPWLGFYRIK